MPLRSDIKKVMVLGSGPIVIGQAAEFDYAGTQACRALKEEGLEVVLVNSNPATIMTDKAMADRIYIEPMTREAVEEIIKKERPDSVLPTLGGQTGLNLAMELCEEGFLDRYGVKLLGAKPETIAKAEDRQMFKDTMLKIGEPIIASEVVETVEDAIRFTDSIGYPVIIRPAYTLGGTGGGIAYDQADLERIAEAGIRLSRVNQILVEKCIAGWKEIEYEVMRDGKGNAITICNMENIDPVGIHTGDSVVVAPDAVRQGVPDAALLGALHHCGARHRGWMQRAVCPASGFVRIRGDRGQSARVALFCARVEGDRLSDREGRGEDRRRLRPGRDHERRHRQDLRVLRTDARLLRHQIPALAV